MRKFLYVSSLAAILWLSTTSATSSTTAEEKLAVRRIAHMWEKRNDPLLQQSIENEVASFLQLYPESEFSSQVGLMQGDLLLLQQKYRPALQAYLNIPNNIPDTSLESRRLHCYAKLEEWKEASEEIEAIEKNCPTLVEELRRGDKRALGLLIAETLCNRAESAPRSTLKNFLMRRAQTYLSALSEHDENSAILQKLSFVSEEINDTTTAVATQMKLAKRRPDRKVHHLLRATEIQSREDPAAAALILSQVEEVPDANSALVKATLLYQTNQDQQLLEETPNLKKLLTSSQVVELDLLCARAASRQGDEHTAAEFFGGLIQRLDVLSTEKRIVVLLSALQCFCDLDQTDKSKTVAKLFLDMFPSNPKASAVRLNLAQQLAKAGKFNEAEVLVDEVLLSSSTPTEAEQAQLQKAEINIAANKPEKAQQHLLQHLSTRPQAANRKRALILTVEVARKQLEMGPTPEAPQKILELEESLLNACRDPHVTLTNEEQITLVYSTAYQLYEKERYRAADTLLGKPPCPLSTDASRSRWLLLQAACDANGFQDWEGFIDHANEAIALDLSREQSAQLRSALCAAYRQLAETEIDLTKATRLLNQAEQHLLACLAIDGRCADQKSLLWHVRREAKREKISIDLFHMPAETLNLAKLQSLSDLLKQATAEEKKPTPQSEEGWLYLAVISYLLNDNAAHRQQLDQLLEAYKDITTPWRQKKTVSYLSGLAYIDEGNHEKALQAFQNVASDGMQDRTTCSAQLQVARLRYQNLPKKERSSDNPSVVAILEVIDALAANRKAISEPVHLEAAIEGALLRASLASKKTKHEVLYQQLQNTKETLMGNETLVDKEYHSARETSSDLESLFQGHLILIDALSSSAKAQMLEEQGKSRDADQAARSASGLYNSLKESNLASTPFLQECCVTGLEESQKLVEQHSRAQKRSAKR